MNNISESSLNKTDHQTLSPHPSPQLTSQARLQSCKSL